MPILHQGIHICSHCQKEFEWVHFELTRQYLSGPLLVERIPNQPKTHWFMPDANGEFDVAVNCPHCGYDNHFVFSVEDTVK